MSLSPSNKKFSGAAIRELARKKLQQKEKLEQQADDKVFGRLQPTSQAPLNIFKEKMQSGFDPLRYFIEEGKGRAPEEWAQSVDSEKLLIVSFDNDDQKEMDRLCESLGFEKRDHYLQKKIHRIDSATYFPKGVLQKIKDRMWASGCGVLVVDVEITPSQSRNIERFLKCPVLDRESVILMIFKNRARSKLAKMQVELAELQYYSTRLSGLWMGLSRQRGGRGGLKGRGLGETQLELDRRQVKDKIHRLKQRLKEAEVHFSTQAKKRQTMLRVALVGYTNAGKSTLMSRLTEASQERAEDRLFSTLDTTVRILQPPCDPPILISDTVGFIKNIPHNLVASFHSTLREALESTLVLVVVDVTADNLLEQIKTSLQVLKDIGAGEKRKILILNKIDGLSQHSGFAWFQIKKTIEAMPDFIKVVWVSAIKGDGLAQLYQLLLDECGAQPPSWWPHTPKES